MPSALCLKINISFFVCALTLMCLPLVLQWRFDLEGYHIEEMPILQSMSSITYRDSLVASIAISIVLLIDLVFEGIYSASKLHVLYILRVAILLGMMVPDMLTLLWISHSHDPALLCIMIELKALFIYFFGLLIL